MDNRPTAVTVISVILTVFGALGLLGALAIVGLQDNPLIQDALAQIRAPLPVQVAMSSLGALVYIGTGAGYLLRRGWMRFVYLGWWVISFIYACAVSPVSVLSLALSVGFLAIVMSCLFTPKARAWFGGKAAAA